MKVIAYYVSKKFLLHFLLVLAFLSTLFIFFELLSEVKNIGRGHYQWSTLAQYLVFTLPSLLYKFAPISGLISTTLLLSKMAFSGELIAMRNMGISASQFTKLLGFLSLILGGFMVCFGEWVVPTTSEYAHSLRQVALERNVERSFWLKQGNAFIHLGEGVGGRIFNRSLVFQSTPYETSIAVGTHAILNNKKGSKLNEIRLHLPIIHTKENDDTKWVPNTPFTYVVDLELPPAGVESFTKQTDFLKSGELFSAYKFLQKNNIPAPQYIQEIATRAVLPLHMFLVVILPIPFLFRSLKSPWGPKLLGGVLGGLVFELCREFSSIIAFSSGVNAWSATFAPVLLCLFVVLFLIRKLSLRP